MVNLRLRGHTSGSSKDVVWHGRFMSFRFSSGPKSCRRKSRVNTIWMQETACHKSPQRIQLPLSPEFLLLLLQLLDLLLLLKLLQLLVRAELIQLLLKLRLVELLLLPKLIELLLLSHLV
jgi:hypothetical protein